MPHDRPDPPERASRDLIHDLRERLARLPAGHPSALPGRPAPHGERDAPAPPAGASGPASGPGRARGEACRERAAGLGAGPEGTVGYGADREDPAGNGARERAGAAGEAGKPDDAGGGAGGATAWLGLRRALSGPERPAERAEELERLERLASALWPREGAAPAHGGRPSPARPGDAHGPWLAWGPATGERFQPWFTAGGPPRPWFGAESRLRWLGAADGWPWSGVAPGGPWPVADAGWPGFSAGPGDRSR